MQPFEILFRPYYIVAIAILGKCFGLWTTEDARGLSSFLFNLVLPVIVFTSIIQADLSSFDNMQTVYEIVAGFIAFPLAYLAYRTHGKSQKVSPPDSSSSAGVLPGEREMLMLCCIGFESSVAIPFVIVNLGVPALGRFVSQDYVNFFWCFAVLRVLSQHFMSEQKTASLPQHHSDESVELNSSHVTSQLSIDTEPHRPSTLKEKYPRIFAVLGVILFPPIFGFLTGWIIKGGLQAQHPPGVMGEGLLGFMQGYLPNGFDVYLILFLAASIDLKSLGSQLGQFAYWKVHIVRLIVGFLMWCLTNFNIIPYKSVRTRDVMLFGFFGSVPSVVVMYTSIFNPKLLPIISYTTVLSLLLAFLTMLFSALVGTYGVN